MKKSTALKSAMLAILFAAVFAACSHPVPEETPCIEQKIEAFKMELGATKIIKINAPDRALYWFIDGCADCGEEIVDEDCNLVCLTDLEGIEAGTPFCDGTIFTAGDWETIWEK